MKPRHHYRLIAKQRAGAALCRVPLSEWVALTRRERRHRLAAARRKARQ